jgi:hypothetical protein
MKAPAFSSDRMALIGVAMRVAIIVIIALAGAASAHQ